MGQITVEEPKTIVDEVTRYECDKCGYVGEEDEMNIFSLTPSYSRHDTKESGHLCNECAEADRYLTFMEIHRDKQRIGEAISWGLNISGFLGGVAVSSGVYLGYQFAISSPDSYPQVIAEWSVPDLFMFLPLSAFSAVVVLILMIFICSFLGIDPG